MPKMILVNINKVKPKPNNPRIIKDDKYKKLVKSLSEFPDMLNKRPLVCFTDKDGSYVVLGGNMRLKALKELNYKEVPIVLADEWTEEQRNEFLIKDNVGFGEWDWEDLSTNWKSEELEEWGVDLVGFENENEIYQDNDKVNNLTQSIELPTITVEYKSDGEKDKLLKVLKQFGFNYKIN